MHCARPPGAWSASGGAGSCARRTGGAARTDVVLNAPPRVGRKLLRPLPAFAEATALLGAYRYFDSRLLIHADPAYVHADRANWAAYNAGVDGRECEGSAWLGALHEPLPTGGTVDVFKSWATRRDADPSAILLERRFKHPLIGRGSLRAARRLRRLQGRGPALQRPVHDGHGPAGDRPSTRPCRSRGRSRRAARRWPRWTRGWPLAVAAGSRTTSSLGAADRSRCLVDGHHQATRRR